MNKKFAVFAALLAALSACSSQQLYGSGQAWQQNDCRKVIDIQAYNRCMAEASTPHEEYRRQVEATKETK